MATTVEKEVARAYHALVKAQGKAKTRYSDECQDAIVAARKAAENALSKVVAEKTKPGPGPEGGEAK